MAWGRCPLTSQSSFCALQQPKCFKAVPCYIVFPSQWRKGGSVFQGNQFWTLLRRAKALLWRTKLARMGCGGLGNTVLTLKRRAIQQPTAFCPIVRTLRFLQQSMRTVLASVLLLVYYLGWVGWGAKEGDRVRITFVFLFGETVRQEEPLMMIGFCVQYCSFSKIVTGNLNEDSERLFKAHSTQTQKPWCSGLSLMLFPTMD